MTWLLVILLYAPGAEFPSSVVHREFPTAALCVQEQEHLIRQALPSGMGGRIIVYCEEKA